MPEKNVVRFTGGEYRPQHLASGLIGLRAPVDIQIQPGETAQIDMKMSCSVLLIGTLALVEPGMNIVVKITNWSDLPLRYQAGEVVTRFHPAFPIDYEIE